MKRALLGYLAVVALSVVSACASPSEGRLTGSDHWYDKKVLPWK
jgi:hypothetical protein